jgi:hypothetical protein
MDRSQTSRPVSDISDDLIKKISGKPDYLEIFSNWKNIVGEEIASICEPHKATNRGSDKILILRTVKGRGLEVQHEACKILDLVNAFLKKKTFSQIKAIQTESMEF